MKKSKLRYYIATVRETSGDTEYDTQYLFKTTKCPIDYTDMVARTWRGGDVDSEIDKDMMGYWSDNALIQADEYKQISVGDFNVLKKYLTVSDSLYIK
jgi:hypothetical protein